MPEKINGTDAMIKFQVHGTYQAYCYASSFSINPVTEFLGVTTQGDGQWKRLKAKRLSYTMSMDGLALLSDVGDKVTSQDFIEQQANLLDTPFEIVYTGETGTVLSISGRVFIQSLNFLANPTGFVNKNVTMQGNGPLVRGNTALAMINLTLNVTGPATATMENVILTDADGNETVVHAGVISTGSSVVVPVLSGAYHLRATLNTDRPYAALQSDADPGFVVPMTGPITALEHYPYPPNSPVWDFTADRYLTWQSSNTPIG